MSRKTLLLLSSLVPFWNPSAHALDLVSQMSAPGVSHFNVGSAMEYLSGYPGFRTLLALEYGGWGNAAQRRWGVSSQLGIQKSADGSSVGFSYLAVDVLPEFNDGSSSQRWTRYPIYLGRDLSAGTQLQLGVSYWGVQLKTGQDWFAQTRVRLAGLQWIAMQNTSATFGVQGASAQGSVGYQKKVSSRIKLKWDFAAADIEAGYPFSAARISSRGSMLVDRNFEVVTQAGFRRAFHLADASSGGSYSFVQLGLSGAF